jgi:hypothetical protein
MATIYVSTTGSDGNAGTTPGSPKLTLGGGLAAASAGDTVQVASGTYSGNFITSKGGSSGNFITIRSEVKHGAKISGNDGTSNESAVEINHAYIRVQDFEITGTAGSGLRNGVIVNADNVEVIGNHIHTTCQFLTEGTSWQGGAGIDFWGASRTNVLVDGNRIHHIGAPGSTQQLVHGLYPAQPATNCRIVNNVVYDCEDYGIQPYPEDEATGWKIVNNTVVACGRGIRTGDNTIVRNNISYNNKANNFDVRGSGSTLSNNISGGSGSSSMSGVTVANPLFTNYSARDLTLAAGSPALDAGTATDAPATDVAATARPQGSAVDAGAYEKPAAVGGGTGAPYTLAFPDGTPYPTIPAGTTVVNVSTSSALSSALSSATAGQRIVLADGSYSGAFSMSGRAGTAAAGISVEAANVGGATFATGSTFRVTNCSYVTISGLMFNWQGEGETFQFRGTSHHCRLTRSTFGPTTHAESSGVQTWVFIGDDCYHIRIDHNEIRNKGTSGNGVRVYGSFAKVDAGQGSSAGCRWVRIDHNIFRSIKPEVGNDKEPVRYGVSTMSRTISNGVIERNRFEDCICEPEVISVKMGGIRTTGNTIYRCAGGPVIRHGTNSVMSDNYVVDRVDTFGTTIGSGGIRFYDADHEVAYNYIDGVFGGNFQGPLLLDTGDAEGSSTNLSGHWRVIGADVQRNVIVDCPEGIRIGDNYSSVPRDCRIQHNLVVDADSGAAITQRVAPSNTVLDGTNVYYATTTAAGMTQDADTIWRKPGFGPRLTYLEQADVGPAGDLGDTDGTGVEAGGIAADPADILNIGADEGQNHFQLQYALDGSTGNDITITQFDDVAAGFTADPYFKVVTNLDGAPAVQFRVRADAATTTGSSTPRSELRETRADGTEMAFDAMHGDHSLRTRVRITHLPAGDPEVVVAQLHNGVTGDRIAIRTQLVSSQIKLLCRINGTQVDPRFDESYAVGDEFEVFVKVLDGGLVEVYYNGVTEPTVTGQLAASGAGASWYWKLGAYAQFDETTTSATEYVSVEHRDLQVTHGGGRVDAGADAQVITGQAFTRLAQELGLTGVTARRWTIVSRPLPPDPEPDPGPGDPGDMTIAAVRHGWGTPHALSDEFDYTGPPNSTKWKLPGADWAGHNGNGRRRPERQTVADGKFVMTGLQNGDTGWCQHRLDVQYGRWEARVRSFAGAPSAGEPDSTSNGNDYHPLLLLWPQSNSRQTDGEYDWMENGAPGENTLEAFIHYPHPGTSVVQQEHFERPNSSLSQFHNIAMEWTSQHIKGFFDGVEWFSVSGGANSVRRNIQTMPAGHAVIQLDDFDGTNQTPATIELEWFRYYSL